MSNQREIRLSIDGNGTIAAIYDDELAGLLAEGRATITRASHVEPGEGGWYADLSPVSGPLLGPFTLRQEALDAEVEYLKANVL